ncbi:hypothetical protein BH10ACI1_BH10ACI1_00250 [soil metagenome]
MFCPNCGKAEQTPDTYCRSCGEFLTDFSKKFSLINKFLGFNTPEKQVGFSSIINLVTAIVSIVLLILLKDFSDGIAIRTNRPPPLIIYLGYLFLALVAVWQLLSFVINISLKTKLSGRKSKRISTDLSANESAVSSAQAKESLPPADIENIVPASVAEETTKILNKVSRQ